MSAEARADLRELERYIAERDSQQRADMILDRIEKTIRTVAFMPGIGRPKSYLDFGTRAFPSPPWVVVYTILPDRDGIRVIRVVDGRRNLPALFKPG